MQWVLNECSSTLDYFLRQDPQYLSGARCFFSQLRSSSAGLVSARGLVLCRSESPIPPKQLGKQLANVLINLWPAQVSRDAWHMALDK